MPVFDFREIALPTGGASRDQFELFARDFLESLGYKTIVGPDRGPDAGRDLVVEESRVGIGGETKVRWLVSCKHNAHSGKAVSPDDEHDIHDRVKTHGCTGFLGFYSTIPSSGLAAKLNAPELPFALQIFDSGKIETSLLNMPHAAVLAKRYFPDSWTRWKKENPSPAKLFAEDPSLRCLACSKDLLKPAPSGIVVTWSAFKSSGEMRTEHIYWCCKGGCDRALKSRYTAPNLIDKWEDLPDLIAPIAFIREVIGYLNEYQRGQKYSDEAFENLKKLLLSLFPLVSREMTESEQERIRQLSVIPAYLGGWGYD